MTVKVLAPQALQQQLKTAERLCMQRNQRLTPLRRTVLELLLRANSSLRAYELHEHMQQIHPRAAPPHVYRALEFMTEKSPIHRIDSLLTWHTCDNAEGYTPTLYHN